jgi:hypothetical protein
VPERHPRAGEQLPDGERLGDVVVGAAVEGRHLVRFRSPSGEDDDRDSRPLPQPADDVEAVQIGQPEVQNDEVGLPGRSLEEPVLAGLGLDDAVSLAREGRAEEAADRRLVLDDQHHRTAPRSAWGIGCVPAADLRHRRSGPPAAPRPAAG